MLKSILPTHPTSSIYDQIHHARPHREPTTTLFKADIHPRRAWVFLLLPIIGSLWPRPCSTETRRWLQQEGFECSEMRERYRAERTKDGTRLTGRTVRPAISPRPTRSSSDGSRSSEACT